METLTAEHNGDRTIVRLNRPQTLNSIDQAMVDDLHEVCDQLEREPRILILTGTRTDKGGIFASGADISQLRDRRRHDALRGINSSIFARIAALPMPVIAAIDGYALGGGAELAYAADFRIATTRVKIGNPEPNLGTSSSWASPSRKRSCSPAASSPQTRRYRFGWSAKSASRTSSWTGRTRSRTVSAVSTRWRSR